MTFGGYRNRHQAIISNRQFRLRQSDIIEILCLCAIIDWMMMMIKFKVVLLLFNLINWSAAAWAEVLIVFDSQRATSTTCWRLQSIISQNIWASSNHQKTLPVTTLRVIPGITNVTTLAPLGSVECISWNPVNALHRNDENSWQISLTTCETDFKTSRIRTVKWRSDTHKVFRWSKFLSHIRGNVAGGASANVRCRGNVTGRTPANVPRNRNEHRILTNSVDQNQVVGMGSFSP